jgi:hypothetical protein
MEHRDTPALFESYRWRNRLLLVFAASPSEPRFAAQQAELAARRGDLTERDLLAFALFDTVDGEGDGHAINPEQTAALRAHYGLAAGAFAVLLIGKDGTEKRRAMAPMPVSELLALIDSMPMRQQEMRESST